MCAFLSQIMNITDVCCRFRLLVSSTHSKRRHTKDAEVARMAVEDCSKHDGEVD
jgi:hypothetical protein